MAVVYFPQNLCNVFSQPSDKTHFSERSVAMCKEEKKKKELKFSDYQ